MKSAEQLLEISAAMPPKQERSVYRRFRAAAFELKDKGYSWPEIAQIFIDSGEQISNVGSFEASLSKSWNAAYRKLEREAMKNVLARLEDEAREKILDQAHAVQTGKAAAERRERSGLG